MANSEKLRLEQRQRQVIIHACFDSVLFLVFCSLFLFKQDGNNGNCVNVNLQARKMQERGWKPRWFAKDKSSNTYCYIGGYWEAREKHNWEACPDIFGQLSNDQNVD